MRTTFQRRTLDRIRSIETTIDCDLYNYLKTEYIRKRLSFKQIAVNLHDEHQIQIGEDAIRYLYKILHNRLPRTISDAMYAHHAHRRGEKFLTHEAT